MRVGPIRALLIAAAGVFHDTGGASAALVAIMLPGLIGFGALGAETGVWLAIKLRNQSAADAAAISAAYTVIAGASLTPGSLTVAAFEAARRNGYEGTTPMVVYPYADAVLSDGAAVVLQQTEAASLAAMFLPSVTVTTRAVAVVETLANSCILALGTSNTDIAIASRVHLDIGGCSAAANSIGSQAIALQDSTSSIAAATLVTAGELSLAGEPIDPGAPPPELALTFPAMIGAPSLADPYAQTLIHAALALGMPTAPRCRSRNSRHVRIYQGDCVVAGASLTDPQIALAAETQISGSWNVAAGQTVDLAPGTYWVTGDLTVQSSAVVKCSACDNAQGAGVTIILAAEGNRVGALSVASGATVNLNAPHSGRFPGLVIVQDSNGLPPGTTLTSSHSTIAGGNGSTLNGLVYFPNSSVTFHGNPSAIGPKCLVLVVQSVEVDAPSSLDSAGCRSTGLTNLPRVTGVALAE
jgi:hypothetical protein